MTNRSIIAVHSRDVLGEGPVHDLADGSLRWVDIGRSLWHRLDLASNEVSTIKLNTTLTGFAPTTAQGYIGAFVNGIALLDRYGQRQRWLHQPENNFPDNRFNDAGTDPRGRFLAGSMNTAGTGATGSLYSLSGDGQLRRLRGAIGICNTVAFSPDGTTLYTADTATGQLMAFAYDSETGTLGDPCADFHPDPALPGAPDGSAVDAEGYLWNARWEGGCLVRLAPDGSTDKIVPLPACLPTSCCFVGTSLFITTSTWNYSKADFDRDPLGGCLLRLEIGVEGVPRPAFVGLASHD